MVNFNLSPKLDEKARQLLDTQQNKYYCFYMAIESLSA